MTKLMNNIKTAALLGLMFGLVLWVGMALGGRQGLVIAFIFGGLLNFISYFFSDKIAIAAMRGQPVDASVAPDLVAMVQRLAQRANLPMPRIYVCPQEAPNAFATGRSPSHAAVAVTRGALELLDKEELEGVLGHELAHIKNLDTLTSTVAATIAGAISFLGHIFFFTGGAYGRGERGGGGNVIGAILMLILAPIAAALIQMAISRSREYVADAAGAAIAGRPDGLMRALLKLDAHAKRIPLRNEMPAQNHMFIVQPLSGETFASLFSTHPPTAERVKRLRELTV